MHPIHRPSFAYPPLFFPVSLPFLPSLAYSGAQKSDADSSLQYRSVLRHSVFRSPQHGTLSPCFQHLTSRRLYSQLPSSERRIAAVSGGPHR
jgi:hypothetical protein